MGQKVVIEILAGPNVGETFEFDKDQILVGRGSQCQMQVASPHVSRQQCELSRQGDQLVLENLGSVNVTYLNDRPIDRVYVQDGDLITFCDVALRVRLPRVGANGEVTADPDKTVAYKPGQAVPGGGPPPQQYAPPPPPGPPPGPPASYPPPPPGPSTQQFAAHPPQPPYQPPQIAAAPPGPPPPQAPPSMPSMGVGMGTGLHGSLSSAPAVPPPPSLGPGRPPGMPPGPPPGMPGMPPGPPPMPGMAGAPPGMPSMPPPMPGGPGGRPQSPGLVSQRQRKRRKGAKGKPPGPDGVNIQLIRNVVVGLAVVMLLLTITSKIIDSTEPPPTKGTNQPAAEEIPMSERLPTMLRGDRTDEEITRDAEGNFRTGETYLRQHRIADENLSIAIGSFKKSKGELALVDPASWPSWTADLEPKHAEAEALLSEKYIDTKWNYVRFYQSADYGRAEAELERITRLVPDKNDERNSYARERLRKVRDLMSGGGKKHRWENRK